MAVLEMVAAKCKYGEATRITTYNNNNWHDKLRNFRPTSCPPDKVE